jgi:hypothetical protein
MIPFNPLNFAIISAALFINSAAYAANKTGVTDFLSKGEISIDIAYSTMNASLLSGASPSTINNGTAIAPLTGQITQNSVRATFNFGVTDKTNVKISHGFQNTVQELDYTFAPNNYVSSSKWQGTTDPEICIQYLLADKNKSEIGAIIYGAVTPASTPSESSIPELMTNGSITSQGANGGAGNGYTTAKIGSTVSFPVYVGNAFYNLEYRYGFVTSLASQHGATAELTFGYEQNLSDSVTLRPYIKASAIGNSYTGQDRSASYSKYYVGAYLISDISRQFSLALSGQYSTFNNQVINYANGNTLTFAANELTLGLQGIYFFH